MKLQWIGNLKVFQKLVLVILPPLVALFLYGSLYTFDKYQTAHSFEQTGILTELAVVNSKLVHEVQKERGMSAGFIASNGSAFADVLPAQRRLTDSQIVLFNQTVDSSELTQGMLVFVTKVRQDLQTLSQTRQQVDSLSMPLADAVSYYTHINSDLLAVVDGIARRGKNRELAIKVAAFGAFLQLKERAGIERAVLSATFGQAGFKDGMYVRFITLMSEQNTYLERFKALATTSLRDDVTRLLTQHQSMQEVERLRGLALSQDRLKIQAQSSQDWFKTASERINLLAEFDGKLGANLLSMARKKQLEASSHMWTAIIILFVTVALISFLSMTVSQYLHVSLKTIYNQITHAGHNFDLSTRIHHQSQDEFGQLSQAFNGMMDDFESVIATVRQNASQLMQAVEQMNGFASKLQNDVSQGSSEADQVASAMTEMSATVSQIAANAVQASEASAAASKEAVEGNQEVDKTSKAIKKLAIDISEAADAIKTLDNDVHGIVAILDVISGISEQTNLLALNAAIEAARAGEQGRGFAVVADEVRTLAQRTQSSTMDIKNMTEKLKSGAAFAVQAMERGQVQASDSVKEVEYAGAELQQIVSHVQIIDSMNEQIATATHEQSMVAEDVNRNAMQISEVYRQTQEVASAISALNDNLLSNASEMSTQVRKFTLTMS
ncbi:methyl-accepting chemotaxis protein [Shewanella sp.]|uniref:methyl-accepting chemotaxis protein n=1 Tax=Shewanella sp. TaxID=50422 RepID=UPI004053AAF8